MTSSRPGSRDHTKPMLTSWPSPTSHSFVGISNISASPPGVVAASPCRGSGPCSPSCSELSEALLADRLPGLLDTLDASVGATELGRGPGSFGTDRMGVCAKATDPNRISRGTSDGGLIIDGASSSLLLAKGMAPAGLSFRLPAL